MSFEKSFSPHFFTRKKSSPSPLIYEILNFQNILEKVFAPVISRNKNLFATLIFRQKVFVPLSVAHKFWPIHFLFLFLFSSKTSFNPIWHGLFTNKLDMGGESCNFFQRSNVIKREELNQSVKRNVKQKLIHLSFDLSAIYR